MYKAGDFTNGKMNEIFIKGFRAGESSSYDSGVKIYHKQLGWFYLVSESGLLMPTIIMLTGVYGFMGCVESYMNKYNDLLCGDDPSKFDTAISYLNSIQVKDLLEIVNDFFNKDESECEKVNFESLFCLLNYLVCEKGCTYSEAL